MSKSQKPKRKYDPTRHERARVRLAAARVERQQLANGALTDLGLAYHLAYEQLRKTGNEEHFHTLATAVNFAARFCEMDIGGEYSPDISASMDALDRVRARGKASGRWTLDGDGLKAVERSLAVHDAQLAAVTYGQFRAALGEVMRLNGVANQTLSAAA